MYGDDHSSLLATPRVEKVELSATVEPALQRTVDWFAAHQHADGYWVGELQGDTILESEYILLLTWLDHADSPVVQRAAEYIARQQLPRGGWALFPGGDLDISVSVKAYWALKIAGRDVDSEPLRRARRAIRDAGGADAVNSFTRFYLALLGQIPFDHCPAVPPEMMLLPKWSPVNIYRMSAWSRTIFVPLSIVWAFRPVRELSDVLGIRELFLREPEQWPPLCCPGVQDMGWLTWTNVFRVVDTMLKQIERWRLRPLRQRSLKLATSWMLERCEDSDGLGAIFPPIIWSTIALRCLGYPETSPEVRECLAQLDALMIEEGDTIRLQPCQSPVWDTAISLRALAAAPQTEPETLTRCVDWLLAKEVRQRGDWAASCNAEPAGWFFEHRNAFYPDIDDTIMVMMGLREVSQAASESLGAARLQRIEAACRRGLQWTLALQNHDGGWGAFDKDNDLALLCRVPFADHNAMIDPSTPDITARVLEMLAAFDFRAGHPAADRAVAYVRREQEDDGSWFGRWGVNHIYGTWQVLSGLARIGMAADDAAMRRGAEWLIAQQQASGGWGESPRSYEDSAFRGRGAVTASQTAWALLGLLDAGYERHPAVRRGIEFLLRQQRPDGTWAETEFTGTGFPRVFYLRYHLYPVYFPAIVLARWRQSQIRNP